MFKCSMRRSTILYGVFLALENGLLFQFQFVDLLKAVVLQIFLRLNG